MQQPFSQVASLPPLSPAAAPSHAAACRAHSPAASFRSDASEAAARTRHSSRGGLAVGLFSLLVLLHALQILGSSLGVAAAAASPAPHTAAAGSSPPCVACEDCVTASCLRMCMPSCKPATAMADGAVLSVEQCKHKGQDAALDIATAACKLSQASCQVSPKAPLQFQGVQGAVSASQCAALANAGCSKFASSPTYSPCGTALFFGHRTCSGRQFSDIYRVKVNQLCLAAMHAPG